MKVIIVDKMDIQIKIKIGGFGTSFVLLPSGSLYVGFTCNTSSDVKDRMGTSDGKDQMEASNVKEHRETSYRNLK